MRLRWVKDQPTAWKQRTTAWKPINGPDFSSTGLRAPRTSRMNDRDSRRSGGYLPGPGDGRTSVDLWGPYDGQSLDRQSAEIVACETSYVGARCAELGPVRSSASLMPPGTAGGREPMNLRVVAEAACSIIVV